MVDWLLIYENGRQYGSDEGSWNDASWGPVGELIRYHSTKGEARIPAAPFYFYTSYVDFPVHTWCPHALIRWTGRIKYGTWTTDAKIDHAYKTLRTCYGVPTPSGMGFNFIEVGEIVPSGKWMIIYEDLSIYSQDTGPWTEAPLDRVLCVMTTEGKMLQLKEYYYGTDDTGPILATDDVLHAIRHVVPEMKIGRVKTLGRIAHDE
jgi:hypothetical protein